MPQRFSESRWHAPPNGLTASSQLPQKYSHHFEADRFKQACMRLCTGMARRKGPTFHSYIFLKRFSCDIFKSKVHEIA
jgi:hypothetical protein